MGQVLHGSATTTEAVRRAIQRSEESLRTLARRHRVNEKTVAKWRKRLSTTDLPTRSEGRSTSLTVEEEAVVVASGAVVALVDRDDDLFAAAALILVLTLEARDEGLLVASPGPFQVADS